MLLSRQSAFFHLFVCAVLTACASPSKKADILDLYELPRTSTTSPHPYATDNDSYYVQPTGYKGCTMINDAPSCGGG